MQDSDVATLRSDVTTNNGKTGYTDGLVDARLAVLNNTVTGNLGGLGLGELASEANVAAASDVDVLQTQVIRDNADRLNAIGLSDYRVKEIFVDTTGDGNADSWKPGHEVYANAEEAANAGEVVWRYSETVAHANGFTDFSAPDTQAHVGFLAQGWEALGDRNVYRDENGLLHVDTLSILSDHEVRITGNADQIVANNTITRMYSSEYEAGLAAVTSGKDPAVARAAYRAQAEADFVAMTESEQARAEAVAAYRAEFLNSANAVSENAFDIDRNNALSNQQHDFATSDRAAIRVEGKAGTASAMAADNVAFPSLEGTYIGGGIGSYGGESAQAMGISHKDGKLALRGVLTRDNFAKGYSLGFQFRIK